MTSLTEAKGCWEKKRIEIPAQATERENVTNYQIRIEVYHAW